VYNNYWKGAVFLPLGQPALPKDKINSSKDQSMRVLGCYQNCSTFMGTIMERKCLADVKDWDVVVR